MSSYQYAEYLISYEWALAVHFSLWQSRAREQLLRSDKVCWAANPSDGLSIISSYSQPMLNEIWLLQLVLDAGLQSL